MKTKTRRNRSASIAKTRWAAYAAAGAATALVGGNSAEAAIHYSGILNIPFPKHTDVAMTFPLDQVGDSLFFRRIEDADWFQTNVAYCRIFGAVSARFIGLWSSSVGGPYGPRLGYPYKLSFGQSIATGHFLFYDGACGVLAAGRAVGTRLENWEDRGAGYLGFRFDNGAGRQYGWVRVRMSGLPQNAFKVIDYAYADPGESIKAGQTSSDEQAPDQGSLGWLALGAAGLLAWRKSR